MMTLHVSQVGAMVECARISSQGDFLDIFVYIREQIEKTHAELLVLGETLQHLDQLTVEAPPIAGEIEQTAAKTGESIGQLPVAADETGGTPAAACQGFPDTTASALFPFNPRAGRPDLVPMLPPVSVSALPAGLRPGGQGRVSAAGPNPSAAFAARP